MAVPNQKRPPAKRPPLNPSVLSVDGPNRFRRSPTTSHVGALGHETLGEVTPRRTIIEGLQAQGRESGTNRILTGTKAMLLTQEPHDRLPTR